MSVVDHKYPEPLLEQVRILPLRQVKLAVQGDCFDSVVAVASPLNVDLAEDGKIGTLASLLQPGKFLVQVGGRIACHIHDRAEIPRTGHVQERLEHPPPNNQEFPEDGLLDLM